MADTEGAFEDLRIPEPRKGVAQMRSASALPPTHKNHEGLPSPYDDRTRIMSDNTEVTFETEDSRERYVRGTGWQVRDPFITGEPWSTLDDEDDFVRGADAERERITAQLLQANNAMGLGPRHIDKLLRSIGVER